MTENEVLKVLEVALLCADEPLSLTQMQTLFGVERKVNSDDLRRYLVLLQLDWKDRGLELVSLASGWRFQSRAEMQPYLARLRSERAPRYSRAVMETLAIIAWRQPVTRGDIEDIRGVSVSTQIIRGLEEREWIEVFGYRDAPGRPALFRTTKKFLDDLGLRSLQELPSLEDLEFALTAPVQELTATEGADAPLSQTSGDAETIGHGGDANLAHDHVVPEQIKN